MRRGLNAATEVSERTLEMPNAVYAQPLDKTAALYTSNLYLKNSQPKGVHGARCVGCCLRSITKTAHFGHFRLLRIGGSRSHRVKKTHPRLKCSTKPCYYNMTTLPKNLGCISFEMLKLHGKKCLTEKTGHSRKLVTDWYRGVD